MTMPIISVENLSKAYRLGAKEETPDTLIGAAKSLVTAPVRNFRELSRLNTFKQAEEGEADDRTLWALKDVSFDVQEGEVVGVIGRNGAGKSTLLKILSRITEPTSGRAVIRGRVSSLLEVGTGFHPELSGRDNVYMNGTILGMTKREIDQKFDEIVDFSGVEKFLDTPIKRYSSGMQVRLAFAVAAHLEPEILIVDEVLAVGDFSFQKKCLGKMKDVAASGRTVLFVSHNMEAVTALCQRVIVLDCSSVAFDGTPETAISTYQDCVDQVAAVALSQRRDRRGNGLARITSISLHDASGRTTESVAMGEPMTLRLDIDSKIPEGELHVGVAVLTRDGKRLFRLNTQDVNAVVPALPGKIRLECRVPNPALVSNSYKLSVGVADEKGTQLDHVDFAAEFRVTPSDVFDSGRALDGPGDIFFAKSQWQVVA